MSNERGVTLKDHKTLNVILSNLAPDGNYILKIQTSLNRNGRALIYNKKRDVMIETAINKAIKGSMGGDHKAFFDCEIKEGFLLIGERAKWQTW